MIWTRERLEAARKEAERWLGVKHVDRRCEWPYAVDCVHYVREVLVAAGIIDRRELPKYSTQDGMWSTSDRMVRALKRCLWVEDVRPEEVGSGDIVVGRTFGRTAHVGIVLDGWIYHAVAGRTVVKGRWDLWKHRAHAGLRIVREGWKAEPESLRWEEE